MSITITFTADSAERLREQMLLMLGLTSMPAAVAAPEPAATNIIRKAKEAKKAAAPAQEPEKVAIVEKEPEPVDEEPEVVEPVELVGASTDLKELLAIKDKTIAVLQQAMADGKVQKLRKLLADYGKGAKSFPEVAIEEFPVIQKAVETGALA